MYKGKAIRIHSLSLNANALYKITQKLCTQCCKLHVHFTNNRLFCMVVRSIERDKFDPNRHGEKKCTCIRAGSRDRGSVIWKQHLFSHDLFKSLTQPSKHIWLKAIIGGLCVSDQSSKGP